MVFNARECAGRRLSVRELQDDPSEIETQDLDNRSALTLAEDDWAEDITTIIDPRNNPWIYVRADRLEPALITTHLHRQSSGGER